MGLFGGDSSSSVKTSVKKTVANVDDDSIRELEGIGGLALENLRVGRGGKLVLNQSGTTGQDLRELTKTITESNAALSGRAFDQFDDLAGRTQNQLDEFASAVNDIARSATGAESETGKLINKLAIPVIVVVAVYLFFKRRKKR